MKTKGVLNNVVKGFEKKSGDFFNKNQIIMWAVRSSLMSALISLTKGIFLLNVIITEKTINVNIDRDVFSQIGIAFLIITLISLFTKALFKRKSEFKKSLKENVAASFLGFII